MLGVSTAQAQNLNHFMNNAIQGVTEQVVGQVAKQMADKYKGTPYMEQNKNIKEPLCFPDAVSPSYSVSPLPVTQPVSDFNRQIPQVTQNCFSNN